MGRLIFVIAGLAALVTPAQAQESSRLLGPWVQTAPAYAVTADNPWTVMIFNADGTFCGGSKKDSRYAEGTYAFDGARLTTIGSTGRLSERTVEFGGRNDAVMHDPQSAEPIVMVRTGMFASCAAMRAHQGQ